MPIPISQDDVQDPRFYPAPGRYIEVGGPYPAVVMDAEEAVSQAGTPQAIMSIAIVPQDPAHAPDGPVKMRYYLPFSPKVAWKLGGWLNAMGEDASNPPKEFDAASYIGRWCQVKIGPGQARQDGTVWPEIKNLEKLDGAPPEIKFKVNRPAPAPVEADGGSDEGKPPF